jgi:hypothetical protein
MSEQPIDIIEQDACKRLGQLCTSFDAAEKSTAQAVCRTPAMLPHQIAQLEDILEQMRRQAQRLRACRLGLRLLQGGRSV